MEALLNKIEENPTYYDCIYTTEISRVGRNPTETRNIIDRLMDLQIPMYIQSIKQRTIDIDGKRNFIMSIVLQVLIEFANNEAEIFKQRSRSGLRQSASEGKAGGSLNFPYGYTKDENKMLIIEPTEAKVIREIFALYKDYNGIKAISNTLNERGVPTRSKITYSGQNRVINFKVPKNVKDIVWSDKQIHDIIKNTLYKGERNFRNEKLKAPAIITSELFEECETIRLGKTHRNFNTSYSYLLKDLIVCGKCGRNFFARYKPETGGDKVYICSSRLTKGKSCGSSGININMIESTIFNELVSAPRILKYLNDKGDIKSQLESDITRLTSQLAIEKTNLTKKEKEKTNLLDYALKDLIDPTTFAERQKELIKESESISIRLKNITKDLTSKQKAFDNHDQEKATQQMLLDAVSNRSQLQAIFKQFISKIIINMVGDKICLATLYIKVGGVELNNTLKLVLDKRSTLRKPVLYSYLPMQKMYNDPIFTNNKLVVDIREIKEEIENSLKFSSWTTVEKLNMLTVE